MDKPVPIEIREVPESKTATEGSLSIYDEDAVKRGHEMHQALECYMLTKQVSPLIIPLLEHKELKQILDQGHPEVPLMGYVDGTFYSVRLDCLVIEQECIKIIDFKTGTRPDSGIPENYKAQLDVYQKLMQSLFIHKNIYTYILWTDQKLIERCT
jgi:ATP-dependent exoDNAse (exonuclease V) beta subunit